MEQVREPGDAKGVRSSGADETGPEPAELLAGVRRGDADAFEALARLYAPRMFRLAVRLTGRREDAEDLVQETLVKALPALKRFEGRARLSTYLLRAMTNLWKNRLRAKRRSRLVDWFRGGRKTEDGELLEPVAVDESPTPLERLEQRDRARQVREAVSRLEPQRRLTLLLREVEEMSYEEIARMTGVPVGTVRSRLARARDDLRRLLEEPS